LPYRSLSTRHLVCQLGQRNVHWTVVQHIRLALEACLTWYYLIPAGAMEEDKEAVTKIKVKRDLYHTQPRRAPWFWPAIKGGRIMLLSDPNWSISNSQLQ
jgi:hypothetical protein